MFLTDFIESRFSHLPLPKKQENLSKQLTQRRKKIGRREQATKRVEQINRQTEKKKEKRKKETFFNLTQLQCVK